MFHEYKEALILHLSSIYCRVSLATYIWTNIKFQSYLVVTCTGLMNLENAKKNFILDVLNVAKVFGIQNKIMSITLDNASANNSALKYLKDSLKPILDGELLHVRCACHVIKLCVKCAFDDALGTVIEKFKVCGKLLRERRYDRDWKQLCISSGVTFKKFPQPIETRWNSLYHLLSTLLRFKDLVTPFYNNIAAEALLLTESDWDILTQCVSLLEIFKEATKKFSGIHYPTAPMFLPLIFNMFFKIIEFRENPHLHFFVSSMEDKFFKYWETIPLVHRLAAFHDRSQGQVAFDIFFDYYAKFLGKNVDDQKKSIMHSLQELFDLYANEQSTPSRQPEPEERSTQQGKMGALGFYQNFKRQKFKGKSVTRLNSNEIQLYLSQYFETPENFDVLEWWKVNSQLYPILATIARDILPVQASSVASESAFSMCGRIIGDQRTNLDTLGMLTCLQDWFAAEKKNRTAGVIDEFASSSSDEDEEYSKYILINRDVI
ncbi:hypothetical protein F511_01253 [Dorcoceras hygrometricum]|uniref:HAT C-terminal dimerisation domain-containing protein n=1 Tax=Dorcoceras hygrometricum TaxID=472368 RepID=A0A2Z7BZD4_9LAMI|nr:hypothetical protein F511_01253 [Dorcoceras hygrometricum]